jgi:peptidoglycan/xylan/chitin deacetylase (PgdA/CDA1 family)
MTYFIVLRALAVCGVRMKRRTVLTYHVVTEAEITRFDRQMRQVRQSALPVFADDADPAGSERCVAITFDDAFEDVIARILPVLARYEVPVTIFVPTGYLGAAASWILSSSGTESRRVASADMLARLNPRAARLGSHSVTHPRLGSLSVPRLKDELSESKRVLESLTGTRIRSLALPYGSSAPDVVRIAEEVGYECVFANVPVFSDAAAGCRLVGRVDASPRDWAMEFYLKLHGAYEWMAVAVPAKRQLLRTLRVPQQA